MIVDYLLETGAFAPVYAYPNDAGCDIFTPEAFSIYPNKQYVLDTKLRIFVPNGYYISVVPKSGLAAFDGIMITNSPGTIDAGYTDTIKVILYNSGKYTKDFDIGDKVAQLIFKKKEKVEFKQVYDIPETERGSGGLGHTGK
jgi:dUTP pyrophosphatase